MNCWRGGPGYLGKMSANCRQAKVRVRREGKQPVEPGDRIQQTICSRCYLTGGMAGKVDSSSKCELAPKRILSSAPRRLVGQYSQGVRGDCISLYGLRASLLVSTSGSQSCLKLKPSSSTNLPILITFPKISLSFVRTPLNFHL